MESCDPAEDWSGNLDSVGFSNHLSGVMSYCTPHQLKNLGILTPPPSNDTAEPVPRCKGETPRSHHTRSEANTLPREFKWKCNLNVFCDETETGYLTSIKEESELDENCKRSIADQRFKKRLKTSNASIRNTDEFPNSSRPQLDTKIEIVVKSTENRESPKKRVNKLLSFDTFSQEQKENSPIKVDVSDAIGSFANKPAQSSLRILKVPPIRINSSILCTCDSRKDILVSLSQCNMLHVIQKILNYLEPLDLVRVDAVSNAWRYIIKDVTSRGRLNKARKLALTSKENIGVPSRQRVKSLNERTPKKTVSVVNTNIERSPKRRCVVSPQLSPRTKRFRYYLQEAQSLNRSERLERCPHCQFPARIQDRTATCASCNFIFCSQCRCSPHPNKPCSFVIASPSSPSPRKSDRRYAIGSKASKKALRRLL